MQDEFKSFLSHVNPLETTARNAMVTIVALGEYHRLGAAPLSKTSSPHCEGE